MRRAAPQLLALALALAAFGCSEKPLAQAAKLAGVSELAMVGQYIFSTSTDNNELRVLDLSPSNVQGRQFLPAPNPLEPLAIPVVSRPVNLARDLHYEDLPGAEDGSTPAVVGGAEVAGPYVYATAAGGIEISVVGATRDLLREVKRLVAPAPVTALASFRGADGNSHLAYATFDGTRALLLTVALPDPEALATLTAAQLAARTRTLDALPQEAVPALLWLSQSQLVVATRQDRGGSGRTFVLDPQTLATRALDFGGPVRMLATHQGLAPEGRAALAPGARVFGVLDEEACGSPACGGIVAVDAATGLRARDDSGLPMATLTIGDALVMGLFVAPGMYLNLPTRGERVAGAYPQELLGVATGSNGALVFFDALGLSQIDVDAADAHPVLAGLEYPSPGGEGAVSVQVYAAGPIIDDPATAENENTVELGDGAARSEVISFTVQGLVPGLASLAVTGADGLRFPVPAGLAARAQVGDRVGIFTAAGTCGEEAVAQVDADAVWVGQVPAGCADRTSFSVRAGGTQPYVVWGSASAYMGRTGPNQTFTYQGDYFQRTAATDLGKPQLELQLGPGVADAPRDARWVLEVNDGFLPYVATVDSSAGCSPALPGAPVLDVARQRLFVAYASANGIVEISPQLAYRGPLSRNVYCYR